MSANDEEAIARELATGSSEMGDTPKLGVEGVEPVSDESIPIPPPPPNPALSTAYPAGLALELALRVAEPQEIFKTYKVSADDWARIKLIPAFQIEYADWKKRAKDKGFSYQMKASAQAENMLKTTWDLIHDPTTPPSVKADLIKFTARLAGYDAKESKVTPMDGSSDDKINITINLGEQDVKNITGIVTKEEVEESPYNDSERAALRPV